MKYFEQAKEVSRELAEEYEKMQSDKIKVNLIGQDGNAFYILGTVSKQLQINGYTKELRDFYCQLATAGDYGNLLSVTNNFVEIC